MRGNTTEGHVGSEDLPTKLVLLKSEYSSPDCSTIGNN